MCAVCAWLPLRCAPGLSPLLHAADALSPAARLCVTLSALTATAPLLARSAAFFLAPAGMEVHDKHGHLHGRKPDWLDPELHAYLYADSQVGWRMLCAGEQGQLAWQGRERAFWASAVRRQ